MWPASDISEGCGCAEGFARRLHGYPTIVATATDIIAIAEPDKVAYRPGL